MLIGLVDRGTYQHADDWDQEDDLNQAVEYEEHAANHLGGSKERLGFRSLECATVPMCLVCPRYSDKIVGLHELAKKKKKAQAVAITVQYARGRRCRGI